MVEAEAAENHGDYRNVRVVTMEQAIAEARSKLDEYEERYGVTSERMAEAFVDDAGKLRETGDYFQWVTTLQRWRELSARLED